MRLLKMLLLAAGMMLLATAVSAQFCGCPEENIPYQRDWMTIDGSLLPGRVSESWCNPVEPGVEGNTDYAMSWDGANLGQQWRVWGMQIDAAGTGEVGSDMDEDGTGYVDYVTNYDGGRFWIDGTHFGPPGSVSEFTGDITYYNVATRFNYLMGDLTSVESDVILSGWFDTCECCFIEFAIANATRVWIEGEGAPPAPYPPFICDVDLTPGTTGELHDACCIMARVSCPNSTEETSWGAIKDMYR